MVGTALMYHCEGDCVSHLSTPDPVNRHMRWYDSQTSHNTLQCTFPFLNLTSFKTPPMCSDESILSSILSYLMVPSIIWRLISYLQLLVHPRTPTPVHPRTPNLNECRLCSHPYSLTPRGIRAISQETCCFVLSGGFEGQANCVVIFEGPLEESREAQGVSLSDSCRTSGLDRNGDKKW